MKIALVLPPNPKHFEIFNRKLSNFYFNQANIMPPLGIGYIAAILIENEHEVHIIDLNAEKMQFKDFIERIKKVSPDIIGFSVLTHVIPQTNELVKKLKNMFPQIPIIYGGRHIELYKEEILKLKELDYAIIGEGEKPIKELINILEIKRKNPDYDSDSELSNVKGLIFREKNGEININDALNIYDNLDDIPFPARNLFKNNLYTTFFIEKGQKAASIITSRGCPFQCNYCAEKFKDYRIRSVNNVIEEISHLYNDNNVRELYFNDGTFTANKKWVINLCNQIIKKEIKIKFNIRTRVDCINEDLLKALSNAGCNRINFGFESGNEQILKNLNKNSNIQQMIDAVRLTKKYNIPVWGFFMLGCPGETKETIKQTISLAKKLDLDYAQFSRLNPFPGTQIYYDYLKQGGRDIWLEYITGMSEDKDVILPDSNFTLEELDKYVLKAYQKFYYRPKYIVKKLKDIKSIRDFIKFLKAAITIL